MIERMNEPSYESAISVSASLFHVSMNSGSRHSRNKSLSINHSIPYNKRYDSSNSCGVIALSCDAVECNIYAGLTGIQVGSRRTEGLHQRRQHNEPAWNEL